MMMVTETMRNLDHIMIYVNLVGNVIKHDLNHDT